MSQPTDSKLPEQEMLVANLTRMERTHRIDRLGTIAITSAVFANILVQLIAMNPEPGLFGNVVRFCAYAGIISGIMTAGYSVWILAGVNGIFTRSRETLDAFGTNRHSQYVYRWSYVMAYASFMLFIVCAIVVVLMWVWLAESQEVAIALTAFATLGIVYPFYVMYGDVHA